GRGEREVTVANATTRTTGAAPRGARLRCRLSPPAGAMRNSERLGSRRALSRCASMVRLRAAKRRVGSYGTPGKNDEGGDGFGARRARKPALQQRSADAAFP